MFSLKFFHFILVVSITNLARICTFVQVFAHLKDLADEIKAAELVSPTLIVIGRVVSLSPHWSLSSNEASSLVEA